MSLIVCPECGHENTEDARYCDMCGIELPLPLAAESSPQTEQGESDDAEELISNTSEAISSEPETPEIPVVATQEINSSYEAEAAKSVAEAEEEPSLAPPVASATVLDWDEPELSSMPSTALEVVEAILVHEETQTQFPIPTEEKLVYLGKLNEEMPVQIDLSQLPNADIISRVHAVIHIEEKNFYLEDAGSLNGTALNGETINPGARFRKQLNTGDTITFGRNRKVDLTFQIQE
ncbi:FHA domain-containing protein [Gloeothece verrucosa]|uniref:FHA domain containing protein n=1 Tax=Gloeothece verrucosa (strain PCC 7822) TaxID=497965 RepID=E0U9K5_GLOV7|nr:FHA domain-containing protein [Gloeothece verrucosa]ADN13806.1 FHA domain containing protein [Gloeothece verrucosa PCC 7822]